MMMTNIQQVLDSLKQMTEHAKQINSIINDDAQNMSHEGNIEAGGNG
jgi:hypothetical protein